MCEIYLDTYLGWWWQSRGLQCLQLLHEFIEQIADIVLLQRASSPVPGSTLWAQVGSSNSRGKQDEGEEELCFPSHSLQCMPLDCCFHGSTEY